MNYAIQVLEKEKTILETALKGWSESAIKEYATSFDRVNKELAEVKTAIKKLQS